MKHVSEVSSDQMFLSMILIIKTATSLQNRLSLTSSDFR